MSISLRWINDGPVNSQTLVEKSVTTDDGHTWTAPTKIYDSTTTPPPGFSAGKIITDINVGVPTQKGYVIAIVNSFGSDEYVYIPTDSSTSPVRIDSTNRPTALGNEFGSQRNHWVDSNGNLWIVGGSPVLHTTTVYKSTDGITWTLMDSAHAIPNASLGNWYWDEVGNQIQFVIADGSGFMKLQEFNISTGLYTTAHNSNTAGPTGWATGQILVSGSTVFVFYTLLSSGHFLTFVSIFNGSSWSTPGPLAISGNIASNVTCTTAAVDANGLAYLIYGYPDGSNNPVMFLRTCTPGGTVSLAFAFPTGSANGDLTGSPGNAVQMPYIDTFTNTVIYSCRGFHPSNGQLIGLIFNAGLGSIALNGPFPLSSGLLSEQYYGGIWGLESPPPVPTLLCPTNTQATVGMFVSFLLRASGGTPPYTFSITGGALPPGLTLGTSTGIISGIPTQAGTFNYTATVTDSNGQLATVANPCPIVVGCPQGFQRT